MHAGSLSSAASPRNPIVLALATMRPDDMSMNDALRAELLQRFGRDQAARQSVRHGHDLQQWKEPA